MTALTRQHGVTSVRWLVAIVLAGCTNESARAPAPPRYVWPDSFAYHVEYTTDGGPASARTDASSVLRFVVRNERYWVWNDGVTKTRSAAGAAPESLPVSTGDTLHWYVRLGRFGDLGDIERDCDPSVAACHDVLPSALPLELRHVIPRLPVWWPPQGHAWADTLAFDDSPRPDGVRGSVVASYRVLRDTVVAATHCWLIAWTSVRHAERPAGRAAAAEPDAEERGEVLVDKAGLIPTLATWRGSVAAAGGATVRGRAWLVGGAFDSTRAGR